MIENICNYLNLQQFGYGWATLFLMILISGLTFWFLAYSSFAKSFKEGDEVVPPFLALPAILFALFVSALATDVWQKHQQAKDILIKETAAVRSLFLLSRSIEIKGAILQQATENYVNSVIHHEWDAMVKNDISRKESALSDLEALDATIIEISKHPKIPLYLSMRLNGSLETIRVSRLQRLALAYDPISNVKWSSSITLAALTLISMGFVHIRRPKAMLISMILTVMCVVATINSLSRSRSPYIGPAAISNQSLIETFNVLIPHQ